MSSLPPLASRTGSTSGSRSGCDGRSAIDYDLALFGRKTPPTSRLRFGGFADFLRIPSFSIELSHNIGNVIRRDDSQLNTQAEQVREMFPQLPFEVILADLRTSGSSQATIENILEGRVGFVGGMAALEESEDDMSDDGGSGRDSADEDSLRGDDGVRLGAGDNGVNTLPLASTLTEDGPVTGHPGVSGMTPASLSISATKGTMVAQRRREMILKYRRRYIESEKGEDLRQRGIVD